VTVATVPKHRRIYDALYRSIIGGEFDPARRLPSEAELVHQFHASRPTVARALRDLQGMGLIERRAGSGTYLRQNPAGAPQQQLGLIVSGLGNTEVLDPICTEIARTAEAAKFTLRWGGDYPHDFSAGQAEALCQQYIAAKAAGVFFAPLELPANREAVNQSIIDRLAAARIPVILLDRDVADFPKRSSCDLVAIDNFKAAFEIAEHLLNRGCRRLGFVARPRYPSTTDLRIAGCREALARRSSAPGRHVLYVHIGNPSDEAFARTLLRDRPDGIVCSNDLTAALLAQTLHGAGISIPDDLRLAAFDDIKYATLLSPPLTTIRQPCRELAQAAVRAMMERIASPGMPPRQILLSADLVVRRSSGD